MRAHAVLVCLWLAACGSSIGNTNGDDGVDSGSGSGSNRDCDPTMAMACNGNAVVSCNSDGTFGAQIMSCGTGQQCDQGACHNACTADGVDLVYVVDEANDFMSFDPRKLPGDPFHKIGTLNCPHNGTSIQTGNTQAIPFSMSVDRDGVAWVLYNTGELFKVSLQTAACTKANNSIGASSMFLFGMGFALDAPMMDSEKLYLAGGNKDPSTSPRKLGYDDTHGGSLTPSVVGNIAGAADFSPELTGTAEAKLYGFFPKGTGPYVQEINKANGAAVGQTWPVGSSLSNVRDWAFAQWGGVFYVFITTNNNGTLKSQVHAVDRMTSVHTIAWDNSMYQVDGAGVSTCAPAVLQ